MDGRPIGFFDSGLGGASVLACAIKMLPHENYIYYGDDANVPYGDRAPEDIRALTLKSVKRMLSYDIKALVLACNTATATCIDEVRAALPIPVISVEPAIKPACEETCDGAVLMLATSATTRLKRYQDLIARMPQPERVVSVACPGLVERIEQGHTQPGEFDAILDSHLSSLLNENIGAIVLGCTHYVFIKEAIYDYARRRFMGECRMFDGNEATVRQLGRVLASHDMENPAGAASVEYHTSGDTALYKPIFERLIFS